ncbi:MAG: phospholipase D-like domain-containing protein [Candidatus Brocadiales bacterium]
MISLRILLIKITPPLLFCALLLLFTASIFTSLAAKADEVMPLVNREYFPVAHKAMLGAKESILCVMYMSQLSVNHPFGGESLLLRDLIGANNRGVDVRVILEDNPAANNKYAYNFLKDAGVNVSYDTDKMTTHDKLLVIDDEYTILGSHNWTFGGMRTNNEVSVLIKSKEVAKAMRKAFENIPVKERQEDKP